jgi:methyltransferase (TIGR00027 family)
VNLRSHDDSWDLGSGLGVTAVMVAAARARETEAADALIRDPYARILVVAADPRGWAKLLDPDMQERITPPDPEAAAMFANTLGYQAVRTHFFDRFFTEAAAAGIRQMVILASGLDSRAYRLAWPQGTVVYEIDLPTVLEYKAATLAEHGAVPTAERREVASDLRQDWPAALTVAGLDSARPTAWLAEGLLPYLPAGAQDRLFEQIGELSAPGSRIAVEAVRHRGEERRAQIRERWKALAADLGIEPIVDFADLAYDDPHRADATAWLNAHGWKASGTESTGEMQRLGRWVEVPGRDDQDGYSTFVVAERI